MKKKHFLIAGLVAWFVYTEIQKIRILLKQEEKIQSIFEREIKFANDITSNNFAISNLEDNIKDIIEENQIIKKDIWDINRKDYEKAMKEVNKIFWEPHNKKKKKRHCTKK